MKCRQLKRVVVGPSSRPTEQESAYGHSCQEILYRLKVIGVSFFRRRVGGMMGEKFFPDGLARTLSLMGRKNVAQECQTAPVERLGLLGHRGAPSWPVSKDACVQVAGGIDAEDEPLMEQQVFCSVQYGSAGTTNKSLWRSVVRVSLHEYPPSSLFVLAISPRRLPNRVRSIFSRLDPSSRKS